ncbi:MAG: hypothetical protein NTV56_10985 [Alphaproteobacteria bacterium]|nr:hypothetical protein [Alphaproteobacteria bacterium]
MQTGLLILGVVVLLSGLVWAAQGSGHFPYPASSFMVDNSRWIYIGLATAAAGAVAIVAALKL